MSLDQNIIRTYTDILREELVPAMGCTEPIAIAYASAILRDALGEEPQVIRLSLSGNIIKNVKSVIVPATGGMHGIPAAVCAGVIAACPQKKAGGALRTDRGRPQKNCGLSCRGGSGDP